MRDELINRIVRDLALEHNLKPNSLFPKNFYTLTSEEQAETIRRFKKIKQQNGQILWDEQK